MIHSRRFAVALRHVAFEDLGLLAPIMDRRGWDVSFCEAAVDDLAHRSIKNADLIIVLGGPIGVYETDAYPFLTDEITLLEHVVFFRNRDSQLGGFLIQTACWGTGGQYG
jgi:GMP synthase (glutamine-hydrolysing)